MKNLILAFAVLVASCQPAYATVYKVTGQMPEMFVGLAADTKPVSGVHPGARFMETDTNNLYIWNGPDNGGTSSNWIEHYEAVTQGTATAGERIEDSTTGTDYLSTSPECAMSAEIDLSGNTSTTVYNGPAILCGYALTVTIGTAAATIDDNTTAKKTLPVSWPVGDYGPMGLIFETSLVVNPADTSTGTLQLYYRPLDADNTWAP